MQGVPSQREPSSESQQIRFRDQTIEQEDSFKIKNPVVRDPSQVIKKTQKITIMNFNVIFSTQNLLGQNLGQSMKIRKSYGKIESTKNNLPENPLSNSEVNASAELQIPQPLALPSVNRYQSTIISINPLSYENFLKKNDRKSRIYGLEREPIETPTKTQNEIVNKDANLRKSISNIAKMIPREEISINLNGSLGEQTPRLPIQTTAAGGDTNRSQNEGRNSSLMFIQDFDNEANGKNSSGEMMIQSQLNLKINLSKSNFNINEKGESGAATFQSIHTIDKNPSQNLEALQEIQNFAHETSSYYEIDHQSGNTTARNYQPPLDLRIHQLKSPRINFQALAQTNSSTTTTNRRKHQSDQYQIHERVRNLNIRPIKGNFIFEGTPVIQFDRFIRKSMSKKKGMPFIQFIIKHSQISLLLLKISTCKTQQFMMKLKYYQIKFSGSSCSLQTKQN